MKFDRNGILLADVPDSGVVKRDPDTRSGNPYHDAVSGKFTSGGRRRARPVDRPANVDPAEYQRMLDAVRDAAREFDNPDEGDLREFIAGRANSPDQVDLQNFMRLVIEQRKNDLVDVLDQLMRKSGPLRLGRRKVRVSAPKGFVRKTLNSLQPSDLANIMHRLQARGHSEESIKRFFQNRSRVFDEAFAMLGDASIFNRKRNS